MVLVFTSSEGRYLSDSLVNSHEVGVLRELGDDFTRAYPLILPRYRSDRHEALFGGSVHPAGDLIEGLCEIPYREGFSDTSAPRCASCCAHIGRSCRRWFRQRVRWQTTRLLRCRRSIRRVGSLKVLASRQQP
jgi:hypothetical protein